MSEKANYEVQFEYTSAGAARVSADLDKLLEKVDKLSREGEISAKGQDKLSGSILRTRGAYAEQSRAVADTATKTRNASSAFQGATGEINRMTDSTVALRYANYDMGRTLLSTSAAITAAGVGTVAAFASQERAFANVVRTSEGGIGDLENALKDLSTQIPVSFNELANIATLGNQLGVAGEDIEAFTGTIATFSSATGITAEASAEAMGKLGNLLNVTANDYDRLGSAIVYVGRTTAASEAQIISIAKELAPAAASAGFTADQVIGLSGALGSLGVPPERSRSTILQFFETLNTSVANGGQDLEDFATAVGVTSAELERMVRSGEGEAILTKFVDRAATVDTVELTQALQNLGLAGLRTNPTIRALAGNTDLLHQSIRNGQQAWQENIELQRQMDIINQTVSASWQRFTNALMNSAAGIGSVLAPTIKNLLDLAVQLLDGFNGFVESDFGGWVVRVAASAAILGGTMMAVRGALALATGSALAFRFAMAQGVGPGIISGLQGLATALGLVKRTADGATTSTITFAGALRAVGRATVVIAILQELSEWLFNTSAQLEKVGNRLNWVGDQFLNLAQKAMNAVPVIGAGLAVMGVSVKNAGNQWLGLSKSLDDSTGSFDDAIGNLQATNTNLGDLGSGFSDMGGAADDAAGSVAKAAEEVRTLLDYAGDLSSVWTRAFQIRFSGQETLDTITSQFIKIREENERAAKAIRDLRNDIRGLNSDISIQEYYLSIAIEYGDTERAKAIEAELAKKRAELADKTAALKAEQDKASKSLKGNSAGAIENRKTILDLVRGYQSHVEALAASGMSQQQLERETARLKQEFIAQATQLGYNRKEAELYARAFDDMSYAIKNIPRNVTVTANANPAIQAFAEFQASALKSLAAVNSGIANTNRGFGGLGGAAQSASNTSRAALERANQKASYFVKASQSLAKANMETNQFKKIAHLADAAMYTKLASQFYTGGYTGQGGKYEPAGVVHRGEYVIPKRDVNQATGLPYAHALGKLMQGQQGYYGGGPVGVAASSGIGGTVSLSAGTIQQIAAAVPKYLVLDGQIAAKATSKQFAHETAVGAY